jgi:hypothetical protein
MDRAVATAQHNHDPNAHGLFRQAPLRTILFLVVFVNWFVCAAVSIAIGGDAIGTTPSHQGFVVTSHGRETPVCEGIWLFSLCYSLATFALMPPAVFLLAATPLHRLKGAPRYLIVILVVLWVTGWYCAVIRNGGHSILDYLSTRAPNR